MTTFEQFFHENPDQKAIYEKEYNDFLLSEFIVEKMKEEKIVVGVIGLGMGKGHLKGAIACGAEVGKICDPDTEKMEKVAKELGLNLIVSDSNFAETIFTPKLF